MKAMIRMSVGAAVGAAEREHFVDASEQHGPGVADGATMRRFGGGRIGQRGRRGGRRQRGDRGAQGRVGRQHAEVAVAVNSRRRHQRGEAIEQLERGQELRAVPARTLFGARVEQMVGIDLAQPVQGERRAGRNRRRAAP